MNGASYSITAACSLGGVTSGKCVLSNKLMLCRLHSTIKKKSSAKKRKTLTEFSNSVPKYWTSCFLNKFALNPFCTMF
jgi:hypothetical protein